ncbi:MAG TPA: hypothetical protein VJC10_01295 [Patescibacteria group bacterium]|nr:hypothetical protein [Patescibacteria group bacterium]
MEHIIFHNRKAAIAKRTEKIQFSIMAVGLGWPLLAVTAFHNFFFSSQNNYV